MHEVQTVALDMLVIGLGVVWCRVFLHKGVFLLATSLPLRKSRPFHDLTISDLRAANRSVL